MPSVEHKILSYMGPRDLLSAKLTCKKWHQGVGRYLKHLRTSNREMRLLRKALLEPVPCFATISLPRPMRDLCTKAGKDVYILSDDSVIEVDVNKLQVAKMSFPSDYSHKWKRMGASGPKKLTVSIDGQLAVQSFVSRDLYGRRRYVQKLFKRSNTGNLLEYVGTEATSGFRRNMRDFYIPHGTGYYELFNGSSANLKIALEIEEFCRSHMFHFDELFDVAVMEEGRAAIFSVEAKSESRLYGIEVGGESRLIARIPMVPANLLIIGTRVVCHSYANKNSIIIFDFWNPNMQWQRNEAIRNMYYLPL